MCGGWEFGGSGSEDRRAGADFLRVADLVPFTRRPMMVVVDGGNSGAFEVGSTAGALRRYGGGFKGRA